MKTIHKYIVAQASTPCFKLPMDWKFLSVQVQNGEIAMWLEVNPENNIGLYTFRIFGTGHTIDGDYCHLGTVQLNEFVWHLYY